VKNRCRECGGSAFCEHGKRRGRCGECGGGALCEHGTRRDYCKECNPDGYLVNLMRSRVYSALKAKNVSKNKRTMEYVGCDVDTLRAHLERQFVDGMTWENQGEWHIDHVRPCASFNLDNEDERHKCFHYTNLQPLWGPDNLSKSAFYDEDNHPLEWSGDHWEDVAE